MRTLLLVGLVLTLTLAGCSSKSNSTTSTTTTTDHMTGNMTGMHMGAKIVEVHMLGNTFVNGTQTIYMGDKVHWVDDDAAPTAHSVTSDATGVFDSSPNCSAGVPLSQVCMVKGSTFDYTFEKAGNFPYHCKVHASMTGSITVLSHNMTA